MSRATVLLLTLMALHGAPQDSSTPERTGRAEEPVVLWHEAKVLLPTRVFHPRDFDPERGQTLVLGFHGYGASARSFERVGRALADLGFLVALPESGYPVNVGRAPGFQWFPNVDDPELGQRVPDLLFHDHVPAVLADLRARYSIERVFTLGFSEGAVAAMGSAIFRHEDFVGAVHFGLPEFSPDWFPGRTLPEGEHVRLLFLHGDGDERVPLSISEETHSFFSEAGYETTFHPFAGGHTVPLDELGVVAEWIRQ